MQISILIFIFDAEDPSEWCKSAPTGLQTLYDSILSFHAPILASTAFRGSIVSLHSSWILTRIRISNAVFSRDFLLEKNTLVIRIKALMNDVLVKRFS